MVGLAIPPSVTATEHGGKTMNEALWFFAGYMSCIFSLMVVFYFGEARRLSDETSPMGGRR